MNSKKFNQIKVAKITEGLLERVVDALLVGIFFNLEFPKYARSSQRWKINQKVNEDLEQINYQNLKRALIHLQNKGLISSIKESLALPEITEAGKKKIFSLLPVYDPKRVWDGKIYLITYDLPVKKNYERNYLRRFLKKIGCGMLQKSVWITPYNPTKLLEKVINERNLTDLILVSSLGKGGTIGTMTVRELIEKVYRPQEVNSRYRQLVTDYENKSISRDSFIFHYLTILKDDPQLPFELLPENWLGEKAHSLFEKLNQAG